MPIFDRFRRPKKPITPHPNNVDGDFYVEFGCCTSCDVPFHEAPGLFQYDESNHCFVVRQPKSTKEVTQMLGAIMCAELQCIRYRGNDPALLNRLAALGETGICDHPARRPAPVAIRNRASFKFGQGNSGLRTPELLLEDFKRYLVGRKTAYISYKFRPIVLDVGSATFAVNWYEDRYHDITIERLDPVESKFVIRHENESSPGLSRAISEWFDSDTRFYEVRWHSRMEWQQRKPGHDSPW